MIPKPNKKYKARIKILMSGKRGITENEILFTCRLSSGRNYLTELERKLGFTFLRHKHENPDGIGSHTRYSFAYREHAQKVIELVNFEAKRKKFKGLLGDEEQFILSLYPEAKAA